MIVGIRRSNRDPSARLLPAVILYPVDFAGANPASPVLSVGLARATGSCRATRSATFEPFRGFPEADRNLFDAPAATPTGVRLRFERHRPPPCQSGNYGISPGDHVRRVARSPHAALAVGDRAPCAGHTGRVRTSALHAGTFPDGRRDAVGRRRSGLRGRNQLPVPDVLKLETRELGILTVNDTGPDRR